MGDGDESLMHRAAPPSSGWRARLALQFERSGARTTLRRRQHEGPLVVQKALYPEGDEVCQCVVVHPPGGIAGGDQLALEVDAEERTHVQLTTPGATKWYGTDGAPALQQVSLRAARGAIMEWLPLGSIVYDGACASQKLTIALEGDAAFIGWDIVCLGRTASAERFTRGEWRQCVDIRRDSALIWSERSVLAANSPLLSSPVGLNGAPVFGTFVAMSPQIETAMLARCRELAPTQGEGSVTRLPDAMIARYRGASSESAHAYFAALWSAVRPQVARRAAVPPRIWRT